MTPQSARTIHQSTQCNVPEDIPDVFKDLFSTWSMVSMLVLLIAKK
jgi:hypothetical protein